MNIKDLFKRVEPKLNTKVADVMAGFHELANKLRDVEDFNTHAAEGHRYEIDKHLQEIKTLGVAVDACESEAASAAAVRSKIEALIA